jgi:hypothetical protein
MTTTTKERTSSYSDCNFMDKNKKNKNSPGLWIGFIKLARPDFIIRGDGMFVVFL